MISNEFYKNSVPPAFLALIVAMTIVTVRSCQGLATGKIVFRDKPAELASVHLSYLLRGSERRRTVNNDKGEYSFGVWWPSRASQYRVIASIPRRTEPRPLEIQEKVVRGKVERLDDIKLEPMYVASTWRLDESETDQKFNSELEARFGLATNPGLRDGLAAWLKEPFKFEKIEVEPEVTYKMVWRAGAEELGRWYYEGADSYNFVPDDKRGHRLMRTRRDGKGELEIEVKDSLVSRMTVVMTKEAARGDGR